MATKTKKTVLESSTEEATKTQTVHEQTGRSELDLGFMTANVRVTTANGFEYQEEMKKFGLFARNRRIENADVEKFTQKIYNDKYRRDQQPICVYRASEVMKTQSKYEITDLSGSKIPETEWDDYLIVADGQHRIKAFATLNSVRTNVDKFTIPDVLILAKDEDVQTYLVDHNSVGRPWRTVDHISLGSISTENPVLLKISELIHSGFNATAAIYLCTNGKKLSASQIKDAEQGKLCKQLIEYNDSQLDIAEKYKVEGLAILNNVKTLSKRYYMIAFLSFIKSYSDNWMSAFDVFRDLSIDDFKNSKTEQDFSALLFQKKERGLVQ